MRDRELFAGFEAPSGDDRELRVARAGAGPTVDSLGNQPRPARDEVGPVQRRAADRPPAGPSVTQGTLRFHLPDVPGPVDFFSPEDLPGFLEQVYVVESQVRTSSAQLDLRLRFALAGELAMEARWHYEPTTRDDTDAPSRAVGPSHDAMRGSLITIHNNERRAYDGTFDRGIDQLVAMGHSATERFHPNLGYGAWPDRLAGWVGVIRPGERSL